MDLDKDARERSFMDQTQRYYASGGDLAALFKMDGFRSRVSFEDCDGDPRAFFLPPNGACVRLSIGSFKTALTCTVAGPFIERHH